MPPYLVRIANDFQICLSIQNSNEFKGPYVLSQVITNYLFKTDDTDFEVSFFLSCLVVHSYYGDL